MENTTDTVKVFKTTISVTSTALIYLSVIFMMAFVYPKCDGNIFVIVVITFGILVVLHEIVCFLRHFHDKIIVTEKQLIITYCQEKIDKKKWTDVRDLVLSWDDITFFQILFEDRRQNLLIYCTDESVFKIEADLYDTFRLRKKLQTYHEKFRTEII